jgi:LysM repeat protein
MCTLLAVLVLATTLTRPGTAQDQGTTHVVQRGETLALLARRYLGDAERWPEIVSANQGKVSDPNRIPAGIELRIPEAGSEAAQPTPTPLERAAVPAEPQDREAAPWARHAAVDVYPVDSGRTVFFGLNMGAGRQGQVRHDEPWEHMAVPPDVFYSAEWLVHGEELPTGQGRLRDFVNMPEARRFQGRMVRPFDRIQLDLEAGFTPSVGDELQVFRAVRRIDGLGWVSKPMGSLTVVEANGESVVGEVNRQFAPIALGDHVRPQPLFPLERGQKAAPVELGSMSATIVGWGELHQIQQFGDIAFLDVGATDGVAVGDEFIVAARADRAFSDNVAGRVQIVGVRESGSSARIVQQDGPVFRTGTVVYLAKKMR